MDWTQLIRVFFVFLREFETEFEKSPEYDPWAPMESIQEKTEA